MGRGPGGMVEERRRWKEVKRGVKKFGGFEDELNGFVKQHLPDTRLEVVSRKRNVSFNLSFVYRSS